MLLLLSKNLLGILNTNYNHVNYDEISFGISRKTELVSLTYVYFSLPNLIDMKINISKC